MLEIDEIIYRLQLLADDVDDASDLDDKEKVYFRDAIQAAAQELRVYDVISKDLEDAQEEIRKLFE